MLLCQKQVERVVVRKFSFLALHHFQQNDNVIFISLSFVKTRQNYIVLMCF